MAIARGYAMARHQLALVLKFDYVHLLMYLKTAG